MKRKDELAARRQKSPSELAREQRDLRRELLTAADGANVHARRGRRRSLARLQTVIREKQLLDQHE